MLMENPCVPTDPPDDPTNQMDIESQNKPSYKEILRNEISTPSLNKIPEIHR